MSRALLTVEQERRLSAAGVLLAVSGEALSAFEIDLISDVRERWLEKGREAWITGEEWTVIDGALVAGGA